MIQRNPAPSPPLLRRHRLHILLVRKEETRRMFHQRPRHAPPTSQRLFLRPPIRISRMLESPEIIQRPRTHMPPHHRPVLPHSRHALEPTERAVRARRRRSRDRRLSLLSLPAARHTPGALLRRGAVRRKAVLLPARETLLSAGEPPLHLLDVRQRLVLHLDQRARSPTTTLPDRLLVRRDVKSNEQHQVARQNAHARERCEFFSSALAGCGEPGEVGGGEVGVGGEVDEAEVDDELQDLHDGDVLFPPDADAARGLEVVPVHDDVHHQVDDNGDPGDGCLAEELRVAEQGGGAVVVGVEEGERLLLEEEEDGVQEFEVFG